MSLPPILPTPSSTPGPLYAQEIDDAIQWLNSFALTPIPIPSGVTVTGDLSFTGHAITGLSKLGLNPGTVSNADTLSIQTVLTVDELFYNDNKGHSFALTKNGALNVSLNGGITTLTGTAALNFTGGTPGVFQLLSSTSRMAALQTGYIQIFDVASPIPAHSITFQSPANILASYTMTLPPALPVNRTGLAMNTDGTLSNAPGSLTPICFGGLVGSSQTITTNNSPPWDLSDGSGIKINGSIIASGASTSAATFASEVRVNAGFDAQVNGGGGVTIYVPVGSTLSFAGSSALAMLNIGLTPYSGTYGPSFTYLGLGTGLTASVQATNGYTPTDADFCQYVAPYAGTCTGLQVKLGTATLGPSGLYTVWHNGAATTMSATLSSGVLTGSDNAHSFAFAAGDTIAIQCTCPSNAPVITQIAAHVQAVIKITTG